MIDNLYEQTAKEFLRENYRQPLTIPITRNNRLRSSLGRFVYDRDQRAIRIELAGFLLDYGAQSTIIDVLKHECIHYALFEKGLPHRDGEAYFEKQLQLYGVSRTKELKVGPYMQYICGKCQQAGETKNRRLLKNPSMYRTTCCHAKIILTGEKVYDGISLEGRGR